VGRKPPGGCGWSPGGGAPFHCMRDIYFERNMVQDKIYVLVSTLLG
jgi:hypothetical protein